MDDSLAAVVLAAGRGSRMSPLTRHLPKVLCPVNGRPLLDGAIDRVRSVVGEVAVNLHADAQPDLVAAHLESVHPTVHQSVEHGEALGTAGAVGHLAGWLSGRDVVVLNGDTWAPGSVDPLVTGWDRERIRIYVHGTTEFGPRMPIAGSALPWADARELAAEPSGFWEVLWQRAHAEGRVEMVRHEGPFVDCATPADYLDVNLEASGGESVVDPTASVAGVITKSVVWPGANVREGEILHRTICVNNRVRILIR